MVTDPSKGVRPILVSKLLPFFTAVTLAPAPKCATIRLSSEGSFPNIIDAYDPVVLSNLF